MGIDRSRAGIAVALAAAVSCGALTMGSAAAAPVKSGSLTLKAAKANLVIGQMETFTGFSRQKRATIYLQRRAGSWKTIAKSKPNKHGNYTIGYRISKAGLQSFRTMTTGTGHAVSNTVKVTGYQWHYLSQQTPTASSPGPVQTGDVNIAGTDYPYSVYTNAGATSGYVDYALHSGCVGLAVTLGLAAQSADYANESMEVDADGHPIYGPNGAFTTGGQTVNFTKNITGVHVLRFAWSNANNNGGAWPAFGNAEVLCNY
jgi:hypothetical protein